MPAIETEPMKNTKNHMIHRNCSPRSRHRVRKPERLQRQQTNRSTALHGMICEAVPYTQRAVRGDRRWASLHTTLKSAIRVERLSSSRADVGGGKCGLTSMRIASRSRAAQVCRVWSSRLCESSLWPSRRPWSSSAFLAAAAESVCSMRASETYTNTREASV